jgi:uncharacterized protein (TIGR02246 family)
VSAGDFEALFARWRAGDAEGAAARFTLDAVYHEAGREPLTGRAAIVAHWTAFFRDGPAWRLALDEIFGDGARFAVTYTWEAQAAPGLWTARPGCAIVRAHAGQIALWREYRG